MEVPALLTTLRELEIALHQPEVRSDPRKLSALLHPQFREFDRSGAEYTRAAILEEFRARPQSYQVWSQDYQVEELAPGTACSRIVQHTLDPVALLSVTRSAPPFGNSRRRVGKCAFTKVRQRGRSINMQPNSALTDTYTSPLRAQRDAAKRGR